MPLKNLVKKELMWFPEKGTGFFPVKNDVYDSDYFNKYIGYANTEMGAKITGARIDLVAGHYQGSVLDIGVGSGDFVETRGNTFGYDINPHAVKWLRSKNLYRDVYEWESFEALTFWDSLEHIEDIKRVIGQARDFVFVSMPIFKSGEHIVTSRHFRKNEHYWYFTREGLVNFFEGEGFELLEINDFEIQLGREDIWSFAFRRKKNG